MSAQQTSLPDFRFGRFTKQVNWERLRALKLDRLVQQNNAPLLLAFAEDIVHGDTSQEDIDPKLQKALHLAQYSVQYLCSSQDALLKRKDIVRSAFQAFAKEEEILDIEIARYRARERALKRQLKEYDKIQEDYLSLLDALDPKMAKKYMKRQKDRTTLTQKPSRNSKQHTKAKVAVNEPFVQESDYDSPPTVHVQKLHSHQLISNKYYDNSGSSIAQVNRRLSKVTISTNHENLHYGNDPYNQGISEFHRSNQNSNRFSEGNKSLHFSPGKSPGKSQWHEASKRTSSGEINSSNSSLQKLSNKPREIVVGKSSGNSSKTTIQDVHNGNDSDVFQKDYQHNASSSSTSQKMPSISTLEKGQEIEVNYRGKGDWYPAYISRLKEDDSCDITYEDGEVDLAVTSNLIRPRHDHKKSHIREDDFGILGSQEDDTKQSSWEYSSREISRPPLSNVTGIPNSGTGYGAGFSGTTPKPHSLYDTGRSSIALSSTAMSLDSLNNLNDDIRNNNNHDDFALENFGDRRDRAYTVSPFRKSDEVDNQQRSRRNTLDGEFDNEDGVQEFVHDDDLSSSNIKSNVTIKNANITRKVDSSVDSNNPLPRHSVRSTLSNMHDDNTDDSDWNDEKTNPYGAERTLSRLLSSHSSQNSGAPKIRALSTPQDIKHQSIVQPEASGLVELEDFDDDTSFRQIDHDDEHDRYSNRSRSNEMEISKSESSILVPSKYVFKQSATEDMAFGNALENAKEMNKINTLQLGGSAGGSVTSRDWEGAKVVKSAMERERHMKDHEDIFEHPAVPIVRTKSGESLRSTTSSVDGARGLGSKTTSYDSLHSTQGRGGNTNIPRVRSSGQLDVYAEDNEPIVQDLHPYGEDSVDYVQDFEASIDTSMSISIDPFSTAPVHQSIKSNGNHKSNRIFHEDNIADVRDDDENGPWSDRNQGSAQRQNNAPENNNKLQGMRTGVINFLKREKSNRSDSPGSDLFGDSGDNDDEDMVLMGTTKLTPSRSAIGATGNTLFSDDTLKTGYIGNNLSKNDNDMGITSVQDVINATHFDESEDSLLHGLDNSMRGGKEGSDKEGLGGHSGRSGNEELCWVAGRAPLELIEMGHAFDVFVSAVKLDEDIAIEFPKVQIQVVFLGVSSEPSGAVSTSSDRALQPVNFSAYMHFNR